IRAVKQWYFFHLYHLTPGLDFLDISPKLTFLLTLSTFSVEDAPSGTQLPLSSLGDVFLLVTLLGLVLGASVFFDSTNSISLSSKSNIKAPEDVGVSLVVNLVRTRFGTGLVGD